jgi:NitT/TauT family transport system permease protein
VILRFRDRQKLSAFAETAPRTFALLLFFTLWDVLTVKTGILPAPYFQPASRIVGAYVLQWQVLLINIAYSLRLLLLGYLGGLVAGFATGISAGWSPKARYWIMPIVKRIGPIPSSVWLPIIIILAPSMFAGSVFMIAFSVWFPMTLMTATGIMNAPSSYFEVANTLGASQRYLLFHVALPAALPNIFMGAFQGLGISCVALISAELLGAKGGLGWYINNATAWAEYNKVYAGVILILFFFSGVIGLLFKINASLLKWQKDPIRW